MSAGERPQTYALDRATTGTGAWIPYLYNLRIGTFYSDILINPFPANVENRVSF